MEESITTSHKLKGAGRKILTSLNNWFFEPVRRITDPVKRRKAHLLAVFLVCMFLIFLSINIAYAITIPDYELPPADLMGYGILLITYIIGRTWSTGIAATIMILMFPMNVFGNVLGGTSENIVSTLTFLLPSLVLASIFFSWVFVLIYGIIINLVIALLPVLSPETVPAFSMISGPLYVGFLTVVVMIIAMVYRSQVERDRQKEIRQSYHKTLEGWSRALEIRDQETEGHAIRVVELALRLARTFMKRGNYEQVLRGALLHDIGKMAIPDSILLKPSALDSDEWAVMQTHPKVAVEMLSGIPFLKSAIPIVAYHHERWDGTGYPYGLKEEQIPLEARIFAVVDVWDALQSNRPYRKAWTEQEAREYLKDQRGKQFDPQVVDRFFSILKS